MLNLKSIKFKFGVKLMSWGSKLVFSSDENRDKFKDAINRNTLLGSFADSGGHLAGCIQPMCEYDTQSVINVLNQQLMFKTAVAFDDIVTTEKEEYYKENWKY